MSLKYPSDRQYLDSHEYVQLEGDIATIGISAFALDQLGDIVFVELPEVGAELTKGESFGTVESVKAVEDVYSPVTGIVTAINTNMIENPEELAEDPYNEGWLIKVRVNDASELNDSMNADQYRQLVEG
jgi:glycine cleavage system H protein